VFQTDNMACYYGWQNKHVKEDNVASIIIRTIALLEPLLSWEAIVVDHLSRRSTTNKYEESLVNSFKRRSLPEGLLYWLSKPSEDWFLPLNIVKDVSTR
jgi:hypothetical protein